MATWMAHFRIADYFLRKIEGLVPEEFVVGNIGADCGEPNDDWSCFTPPSDITHWRCPENPSIIDADGFYTSYVQNNTKSPSFFLGYTIHLLTDTEWGNQIYHPKKEVFQEEFKKDARFIWTMKKDWYDLDHAYLRDNPNFSVFQIFSHIDEFPNPGLPYYSDTAIIRQIRYITEFYQKPHPDLDREYPYLKKWEMDEFVEKACLSIEVILREKAVL